MAQTGIPNLQRTADYLSKLPELLSIWVWPAALSWVKHRRTKPEYDCRSAQLGVQYQ